MNLISLHLLQHYIHDPFLIPLAQSGKHGFDFHPHQSYERIRVEGSEKQVPELIFETAEFGMGAVRKIVLN